MQVVASELIQSKKVLLRLDIDVPLRRKAPQGKPSDKWEVIDDFRLKAGLPALKLCLESAEQVIVMGHIGRPEGKVVPELSVEPIYDWLISQGLGLHLRGGKLKILENLRFEESEEKGDLDYAKELAALGDFYINEAFAAYHPAASTTVLPTLLPHYCGLQFKKEVERLTQVRENPEHPLVVIIGGAKVEDKLPVVEAMAKIADYVLVGGKIAGEVSRVKSLESGNVLVGELNEEETDITKKTAEEWKPIISKAKMIVWNGPMGKVEEPRNFMTHEVANLVIQSNAETILGGGDTITYLGKLGLLERFSFVSTGGGAMLKFLIEGTLPTIEALR